MLLFDVQFKQTDQQFSVAFQDNNKAFDATFEAFQKVAESAPVEQYTGDYVVTPMFGERSLQTKDKLLTDNVIVKAIPYVESDNAAGGKTVIIG